MTNFIKIRFNQEYKSFKQDEEYTLNGKLIIISGINGAGKSQLLEGIKLGTADIFINDKKISNNNILKYSFKDNISLPSFGAYDYEYTKSINDIIIRTYRTFLDLYHNYHENQNNQPNDFEMYLDIDKGTTFEEYCINNIGASISFKKPNNSGTISKNVSKNSILQIINTFYDDGNACLNLSNEEVLRRIPNDFLIKFDGDEIDSIVRIFTEAARLRFLERNRYADTNEIFDNDTWLKKAPWTEINKLFEKLHFDYRFSDDYMYEIPYLKEEPQLYAFENNIVNNSKVRNINDLSDGEKAILKLVISTYDRKQDNTTKILLLDEYDATLNPSLIKDFYIAIQEYYLNKNIIVIITTHSPITISMAPEDTKFYEIFRQVGASPILLEVNPEEYAELKLLETYYDKIKNPLLRLNELNGENRILKEELDNLTLPLVITEGKTDWKHIKKAKEKANNTENYKFYEYTIDMGDSAIINMLKEQAKIYNSNKRIFVFDNDNDKIVREVTSENKNYKCWGNQVYSFVIPKPGIREIEEKISIEHYYSNDVLKKEIECGDGIIRRIYCGNDFQTTGLNKDLNKRCNKKDVCGQGVIRVLSGSEQEKVFDLDNESNESTNYALSKDDFFEKIINSEDNNIDMSKFSLILNIISEIINIDE